jgi:hypothetical protein
VALTEKIRVLFEVDDKGSFGKLKKDINDAEGATGKLKAGTKGLGDMLKQNAAPAAIAAGAALVAFGVKAVNAFQDAALGAGKFADATGLAVEDASRWIEVAGDLGIEAGTIQGAFQKLNKSIADGKPALSEYGVEIVKTKDGIVDANATFINAATTIGAIEDPTKRAKAAQELFGKSYGEVAELLEMSANDVKVALEGVSDAKIISEEELQRARKYRARMDELNDKLQDLSITVGGRLADDFVYAAENAQILADAVGKIPGGGPLGEFLFGPSGEDRENVRNWLLDVTGIVEAYGGAVGDTWEKSDKAAKGTTDFYRELQKLNEEADLTEGKFDDVKDAAAELGTAYDKLKGKFDNKQAWQNAQDAVGDLMTVMADSESTWRDLETAADDAALAYADFIMQSEDIPDETKSILITELDQGNLDMVRAFVDTMQKGFIVPLIPEIRDSKGTVNALGSYGRYVPGGTNVRGATGGIVTRPTMALIGEAGPEAVVPLNRTPGSSPLPGGMGGGGNTININTAADPNSVIAAIKQYERLNGKGWRS